VLLQYFENTESRNTSCCLVKLSKLLTGEGVKLV